jgi:hypothetical protein
VYKVGVGSSNKSSVQLINERKISGRRMIFWVHTCRATVAVPAGAVRPETTVNANRDFWITDISFFVFPVGFPLSSVYFRVGIRELGFDNSWQNMRFVPQAFMGSNMGLNDLGAFKLPEPYYWKYNTSMSVEFENISGLAAIPELILIGLLD